MPYTIDDRTLHLTRFVSFQIFGKPFRQNGTREVIIARTRAHSEPLVQLTTRQHFGQSLSC
jgi:hypothetical protein